MLEEIKNRISQNLQNKEFMSDLYIRDSLDHKFYPLVVPFEDEIFLSWIIRQSIALSKSPSEFLSDEVKYWNGFIDNKLQFSDYLTPKSIHHRIRQFIKWCNVVPLTDNFVQILQQRGISNPKNFQLIDNEIYEASNLQNFYRTYFPKNSFDMRKELVFCPQCFQDEERRYFKLTWLNPLYVICSIHKVPLKLHCSGCEVELFDMKRIMIKSRELELLDFKKCYNCEKNILDENIELLPNLLDLQDKVVNYSKLNSDHSMT